MDGMKKTGRDCVRCRYKRYRHDEKPCLSCPSINRKKELEVCKYFNAGLCGNPVKFTPNCRTFTCIGFDACNIKKSILKGRGVLQCFRCGTKLETREETWYDSSNYPCCRDCAEENLYALFDEPSDIFILSIAEDFNRSIRKYLNNSIIIPCPECEAGIYYADKELKNSEQCCPLCPAEFTIDENYKTTIIIYDDD